MRSSHRSRQKFANPMIRDFGRRECRMTKTIHQPLEAHDVAETLAELLSILGKDEAETYVQAITEANRLFAEFTQAYDGGDHERAKALMPEVEKSQRAMMAKHA